jgi:hypothetical protein
MSKRSNKIATRRQIRRVLNRSNDFFTRIGRTRLYRFGWGETRVGKNNTKSHEIA